MRCSRLVRSMLLSVALFGPSVGRAQDAQTAPAGKYAVTILEEANSPTDMKDGRFSSQTTVRVTDDNKMPVAGVMVTFTLPQMKATAFANGRLTSMTTTNDRGEASSGAFFARAGSSFTISVSAATPGAVANSTAIVTMPGVEKVARAKSKGISKRLLVAIIAGAGAAVVVGVVVAERGGGSGSAGATGTVGAAGTSTFGAP